ncbi:MAG: NTP transferase domain-containing protein [Thiolinea sp.]
MRSALPKVLHAVAGKPMLHHVVDACQMAGAERMAVVYGHGGEQVRAALADVSTVTLHWALQAEQKGTGHAVMQAIELAADDEVVLVGYGDVPLIRPATLQQLHRCGVCGLDGADHPCAAANRLWAHSAQSGRRGASDCGRKDASAAIRAIQEINTGFIAARC